MGVFCRLLVLFLTFLTLGCNVIFKIGKGGGFVSDSYNEISIKKREVESIKQNSRNNSKDFFLNSNNRYWKNTNLDDIKFYLEETKKSVIGIGKKKKFNNPKYVSQSKIYNIQKKCYFELPKSINNSGNSNSEFSGYNLTPEENCFYENLDEGKEKTIVGDGIILKSTDFGALDEWDYDNFVDGMSSFLNSCSAFERYKRQKINISAGGLVFGDIKDWIQICHMAREYQSKHKEKEFFDEHFQPFAIYSSEKNKRGTFTGYYELTVNGSKHKTSRYRYPIYKKPPECAKKSTCYTQEEINNGAIADKGLELYWVDDFIDLWRLQMQGSGIVDFEDGSYARVGFGGGNGYAYRRFLDYFKKHKYLLPPGNHSASFIYQWMRENPEYGIKAMNYNPAYLYFVKLQNDGRSPLGAQVVPLTSGRSVAVDNDFIPLGMPMWIETKISVKHYISQNWLELNRFVVAQDIGSAIKGAIRADIFFGHGAKARYLAETLRYDGREYMIIPKIVVNKIRKK